MAERASEKKKNIVKPIKLEPILTADSQIIYSNFVNVANTDYDFRLNFMEFNPSRGIEELVRLEIEAQVILPLNIVKKLINALNKQVENYEKGSGNKIPE